MFYKNETVEGIHGSVLIGVDIVIIVMKAIFSKVKRVPA
jgi:hypothetical protein